MKTVSDPIVALKPDQLQQLQDAAAHLWEQATRGQARLLVFGVGSFGDALQATPLLHALRREFSDAAICLVHPNKLVTSLFECHEDIDQILILPGQLHAGLRALVQAQGLADLIVDIRYVVQYTIGSGKNRLSSAQHTFIRESQTRQTEWLPFVRRFPYDNDALWRAAAQRGWTMMQLIAQTAGFPGDDFEKLHLSLRSEDDRARRELPARYIAVCNSAEPLQITQALWTKVLPAAKMAALCHRLKEAGLPLVHLGARDDAQIRGIDFDMRGITTIREAAVVLRDAAAYVGPEGGLANLARAVGTRSAIFFGSTPPEFFGYQANINIRPQRCGGCWWTTPTYLSQCPRLLAVPECTDSLSEDAMVAAVREIIQ